MVERGRKECTARVRDSDEQSGVLLRDVIKLLNGPRLILTSVN